MEGGEMSDTPISDSTPHNVADLGMRCRWLERQLNSANERIKRLEEALSWRWRPIETAPHNHTWVLGYDEKDGEIGMIIFERGDESEPQWTDVVRTWSPTHWMPLPDKPKAKEAKL
jgi:hypothetical protein